MAKAADRMREASAVLARGGVIQPLMDVPDKNEGETPMAGAKDGRELDDRDRSGLAAPTGPLQ